MMAFALWPSKTLGSEVESDLLPTCFLTTVVPGHTECHSACGARNCCKAARAANMAQEPPEVLPDQRTATIIKASTQPQHDVKHWPGAKTRAALRECAYFKRGATRWHTLPLPVSPGKSKTKDGSRII